MEAVSREAELGKKERAKLALKLDSELLEVRKIAQRAERQATKAEAEVKNGAAKLQELKEELCAELARLKEPLAAEVQRMIWENNHLAEEFESSKQDYRVLASDFLKLVQG